MVFKLLQAAERGQGALPAEAVQLSTNTNRSSFCW
jgi:hypothetical protein